MRKIIEMSAAVAANRLNDALREQDGIANKVASIGGNTADQLLERLKILRGIIAESQQWLIAISQAVAEERQRS